MRGGLTPLAHRAARLADIDLEATRAARHRLHAQLRLRNHAVWVLRVSPPAEEVVQTVSGGGEGPLEAAS